MALLQRRMASSVYAVRRSLERMRERREKILEDSEAYRRDQIERRVPGDFDDLTEEEQQRIVGQLEGEMLSADPVVLRGRSLGSPGSSARRKGWSGAARSRSWPGCGRC